MTKFQFGVMNFAILFVAFYVLQPFLDFYEVDGFKRVLSYAGVGGLITILVEKLRDRMVKSD